MLLNISGLGFPYEIGNTLESPWCVPWIRESLFPPLMGDVLMTLDRQDEDPQRYLTEEKKS